MQLTARPPVSTTRFCLAAGLIFAMFFTHGAWPVPEVNEVHYLGKARHYWNPNWCANDFFYNTPDAHYAFNWLFGWTTLFLSLPQVAWVGRVVCWMGTAMAWTYLAFAIRPSGVAAVASAGLFLVGLHNFHFAGEWVIGGVEAKCLAFIPGLLAMAEILRGRVNRAMVLLGVSTALHVLVGGWLTVCAGFAWWVLRCDKAKIDWPTWWAVAMAGGMAAIGVVPGVALSWGVDAVTAREAARIYIERLPHHLDAFRMPWLNVLRFAALALVWILVARLVVRDVALRRLAALVHGALALAVIGIALGGIEAATGRDFAPLLRYYWFRTADVLLPLGLAVVLAAWLADGLAKQRRWSAVLLAATILAVAWHLQGVIHLRMALQRPPADDKMLNSRDWREVCKWIDGNTPGDAIFLTPRLNASFHWYANRAEVVSRKDVPQGARALVEWYARLGDVHHRTGHGPSLGWRASLATAPPADLVRLGKTYQAEYIVTEAMPPLPFELLNPPNATYAVYRLPKTWNEPPATNQP